MKNYKITLIMSVILLVLFGAVLFIFNKKGFLSFEQNKCGSQTAKNSDKNGNVAGNSDDNLKYVVDDDVIQVVNKFWYKMRGIWKQVDGDFMLKIDDDENDYIATISFGMQYNGVADSVIVSIEPVGMSEYSFNILNPLKSDIIEKDELNQTFQLYKGFSYAESYIFDVSDLYMNVLRMKLSDSDSYYEFKRVSN